MPSERAPRLSRFNLMQFVNGNENGPTKDGLSMALPEWCLAPSLSLLAKQSPSLFRPVLVN